MGLLDIFKTQWSAGTMTEDDRKRIFWLLKRKTSYTAWKRVADRWDDFAVVFKKQVVEEPHAPGLMGGTSWEPHYPEIVKAQVFYEKALANLLHGDRSCFLYNELGYFRDAANLTDSWYMDLVNNGYQGDHFLDGKYVDELKQLMIRYSDARRSGGYLQPKIAEIPAEAWGDIQRPELLDLPCPNPPPKVPEPERELTVRTGDEIPVFGIYEPQIKDGYMSYLWAGVPAPSIWGTDGHYAVMNSHNVTWRLIWEDTRYQEDHPVYGRIPPEEASYFPADKPATVATAQPATVMGDMLISDTGQTCPKTGLWSIAERLDVTLSVDQGTEMPQFENRNVTWVYLRPRV